MSDRPPRNRFTAEEWRSLGALCGVFFLRMLGLFMILPVLSPYAKSLPGSTPILIGLAMGAFPLTQTILQVPFGWVSDRIGRKPVIIAGLVLFGVGSIGAGMARTIWELIFSLGLQGSGAIASVIIAFVADHSREAVRTRAMALVGGAVGIAFGLGFVLGPLIAGAWSAAMIFYVIGLLSGLAILVVLFLVPETDSTEHHEEAQLTPGRLSPVLADGGLWKIHTGIFVMNGSLRGLFVVLPFLLLDFVAESQTWMVYLGVLGVCGVVMFPAIFLGERKGILKWITWGSIGLMALGMFGFIPGSQLFTGLLIALFFYFLGFSLLEAILPSLVTNLAPERNRGTAVGIFNMSQYLGAFIGSLLGGYFLEHDERLLFLVLGFAIIGWGIWFISLDYDYSRSLHRSS